MGRYGTMFVNYARCKGTSTKISFTTISVKSVRVVHLLRADVEGKCDAIRWHPHCKFIGVKKGNGKMFFFFLWEEHGYTRYILSVGKSSLNRIWESDFSFFFYSVARFVENIGKVKSYATAKFAVQGWVSGASLEFHSFTIQRSDGERMQAARCGGSVVDNGLHELSHTTVIDLT